MALYPSPYYLDPSHNSSLIISPAILNGENYREWKPALRCALIAMRKIGFVDGTINRPSDSSADLHHWNTVNAMLICWIMNTIDPSLQPSIAYHHTAKELWDDLATRFSVGLCQIRYEISNCRQNAQSIASYYFNFRNIWDEYNDLRVPASVKCTCGYAEAVAKDREDEMVHLFLIGLDDYYDFLRSSIVKQVPLPSLSQVFGLALQEERRKSLSDWFTERSSAIQDASSLPSDEDWL